MKDVAEAMEAGAEASRKIGEQLSQDVAAIRADLDELLKKTEQRIIVIMDDIDRLTAQEIAQLFLIVKAVADFPNTVYLLAFDHAVVCKAITSSLGLDGASYVEKIVQVQIDIPPCSPVQLQDLFLSQLSDLLDDTSVTEKTKQDFGNLFHDGLKDFFQTPRSVKRLTNVLRVLLPAVQGEVYWPDFVAITSLMVFVPEAYRSIRDSAQKFTGREHWPDRNRDEGKKFYESWLRQIRETHREAVGQLVQRLFPQVELELGNHGYGSGFESQWRADLRICSPDCFDRYFHLRVPEGEFSEAEWRDVVRLLDNPNELNRFIAQCCKASGPHGLSSRAKLFVERASLFASDQATPDQAKALFQGIVRNGDLIISIKDTDRSNLLIDNQQRLMWLLQHCLRTIADSTERDQFVDYTLKGEAGLRTAVEFLWWLGAEHGKYGQDKNNRHEAPLLSLTCVDCLEAALLGRIRTAAADGSLEKDPQFTSIVFHWERFGGQDEAKTWIQQIASTDEGFVRLVGQLRGFGAVQGMGDHVATPVPTFGSETLLKWLDGIESRKRAEALLMAPPSWLTPDQMDALQLLVRAITTDGKSVDLLRPDRVRQARPAQREETEVKK